jgi:hypothetical protein
MTNPQTKAPPKSGTQLFGVIKIRDVWLNDMGDGPSLIWDNKAKNGVGLMSGFMI